MRKALHLSAFALFAVPAPFQEVSSVARHVRFLASEELKGRRSGTPEADVAARYIAAEFLRVGCKPRRDPGEGETSGGFDQVFEVPLPPEAGPGTKIEWSEGERKRRFAAEDLRPLPFSSSGTVEGDLVFVERDALAKGELPMEADGTILVVDVSKQPSDPHAGALRSLANAAKKAVAAAVLVVGTWQPGAFAHEGSAEVGIPVAMVRPEAREQLPRRATLTVDLKREKRPTRNVLAYLPGSGSGRGTVVVGAHFDHLGLGGEHSLAPGSTEVHFGADDNASGTAALLEIARLLAPEKGKYPRDILFIAFSAEEEGLLGSSHFVKNPILPLGEIVAMLNLDMVGRMESNRLEVSGVGTSPRFGAILEKANASVGLQLKTSEGAMGYGGSDHLSFYQTGIPVLFFFTGLHSDYHKPSDTADKVNLEGVERVACLGAAVLREIASSEEPFPFTKPEEPERREGKGGPRAWLGTIPDYGDHKDGLPISGTSAGSPAEKAGLQAADVIVRIADTTIANIYDLTAALETYKAGQTVEVEFLRNGERKKVSLTLGSR